MKTNLNFPSITRILLATILVAGVTITLAPTAAMAKGNSTVKNISGPRENREIWDPRPHYWPDTIPEIKPWYEQEPRHHYWPDPTPQTDLEPEFRPHMKGGDKDPDPSPYWLPNEGRPDQKPKPTQEIDNNGDRFRHWSDRIPEDRP